MTQRNNLTTRPILTPLLFKRMLLGAGIALVLIAIFLSGVREPKPEWGKLWMLKPLIVVPLAGAMGAAFSYILDPLRHQGAWKTLLAITLSLIVYIIALWLGTVLGLNGTLWN